MANEKPPTFPTRQQAAPARTMPAPGSDPAPEQASIVGESPGAVEARENEQANQPSVEEENQKADESLQAAKDMLAEGNRVEAFGKHGSQDENTPLSQTVQLQELDEGAVDMSQQPSLTMPISETEDQIQRAVAAPQGTVTFSSHPVGAFKVGRFQFTNGQLILTTAEAQEFESLLERMPPRDRNRVRKIDRQAAEKMAERFLTTRRVRGVDTAGVQNR